MYNLSFISDDDLFNHVKETVLRYKRKISLNEFTRNILDPIKMSFDSIVYEQSIEQMIQNEVSKQIDKSNNNQIGYFHQNIFHYIGGDDWRVPQQGLVK